MCEQKRLALKKEVSPAICKNIDESGGYYANNKSDTMKTNIAWSYLYVESKKKKLNSQW